MMDDFKKFNQEQRGDSFEELEDISFSTLLSEIEIRANYQTPFKNSRNDSKNLYQELNSLQREYDEEMLKESQYQTKRSKLLSQIQEKKSIIEIENAVKCVNALKRLTKIKWLQSPGNLVEGFVFNEKTAYLNYFSYEISDPSIKQKLWNEIRESTHHQLYQISRF